MTARRRTILCLVVALLLVPAGWAQGVYDFQKAEYYPPAPPGQKKSDPLEGTLRFDSGKKEASFVAKDGAAALTVKYDAIKNLLYEKASKPRYAAGMLIAWPLLFTKSKKHFLTIQSADAVGTGQHAIVRLHKDNFREALARAESETGKKVERTEER